MKHFERSASRCRAPLRIRSALAGLLAIAAMGASHASDAIYVGNTSPGIHEDLSRAFAKVTELDEEPYIERGYKVRRFRIFLCKNFKGLQIQPPGGN